MIHRSCAFIVVMFAVTLVVPSNPAVAQEREQPRNAAAQAQPTANAVERTARRYRIGVLGGIGLDPELIEFGAQGAFGPIFTPGFEFRPGIDFGLGEVTTTFGINLDGIYTFSDATTAAWTPYVGAGPNFALSHRGFDTNEEDDNGNRFDFSDTDFITGFNFIAGVRRQNGLFIEMRATAYGVSNVRLLAGFNF